MAGVITGMKTLLTVIALLTAACGDNLIATPSPDATVADPSGGRDDWNVEEDVPDTSEPSGNGTTPDAGAPEIVVDAGAAETCDDEHTGLGNGHEKNCGIHSSRR